MALPKYAAGYSKDDLVRINCESCKSNRHGLLNKPKASTAFVHVDPEIFVTCLKCQHRQRDAENWNAL
ncbi:hypothetical protein D3C80_2211500 [compost metagenome]